MSSLSYFVKTQVEFEIEPEVSLEREFIKHKFFPISSIKT